MLKNDCWINGLLQSTFFLCCSPGVYFKEARFHLPDCWQNGWAHHSRELCCNDDRLQQMNERVLSLTQNNTSSCANADDMTLKYLEDSAERLFYLGEPFGNVGVEEQLIENSDEIFEALGEGELGEDLTGCASSQQPTEAHWYEKGLVDVERV